MDIDARVMRMLHALERARDGADGLSDAMRQAGLVRTASTDDKPPPVPLDDQ